MKVSSPFLFLVIAAFVALPLFSRAQCVVINEVMVNAAGPNDGVAPNTAEWVELYNTCNSVVDISCWVMTDGDFTVTFPAGTTIGPYGFFTIGSVNSGTPININWATCGCTSGNTIGVFTNTSEQLILNNSAGTAVDGLYWGAGQFSSATTNPITSSSTVGSCAAQTISYASTNSYFTAVPGQSSNDGFSIHRQCDGSATWLSGGSTPTPGATNSVPAMVPSGLASSTTICAGDCISFTGSSTGTPTSWSWSFPGAATTTSAVQNPTNICYNNAGTYNVTLNVTNTCFTNTATYTALITVNQAVAPTLSPVSPVTVCNGNTVTLNSNGTNTLQWYLGGNPIAGATSTSYVASLAGTYTLQSSINGCTAMSQPLVVSYASATQPSITSDAIHFCVGNNVTFTATPGYSTYQWYNSAGAIAGATAATFTSNQPETYSVGITDANGCANSSTTIQTFYSVPTVNAGNDTTVCDGQSVTLAASGTQSYAWDNGVTDNVGFVPTSTLTYTVTGTDSIGCTVTDQVVVNVTPLPVITAPTVSNPTCEGDDMLLTAQTLAGASYSWTGPNGFASALNNPTVTAAPLTATGTYSVLVTLNNCSDSFTVDAVVDAPTPSVVNDLGPYCITSAPVDLSLASEPGVWSGAGITNTVTGLFNPGIGAGVHVVTFDSDAYCTSPSNLNVTVDALTPSSIDAAGPFCIYDAAVDLNSVDEPGVWSGVGITSAISGQFTPGTAGAGNQTITFQSNAYCTAPATTTIQVIPTFDATIANAGPYCVSVNNATLTAATAGGTWTGPQISATGSISPNTLGAGSYTYTYTTNNQGCTASDDILITVNPLPAVSFSIPNAQGCVPFATSFNNTSGGNSTACVWSVDGNPVGNGCGGFNYTFTTAGCFDVSLTTTDGNGCSNTVTQTDVVCTANMPVAQFTWEPVSPSLYSPLVTFTNTSQGNVTNAWTINSETSSEVNPVYTIPATIADTFDACLAVTGLYGCADQVCYTVHIDREYFIYVPNTFTPDGDGINDVFYPVISGLSGMPTRYEFYVYDRWGNQVFVSHDPYEAWIGNMNGGTFYVADGAYNWYMIVELSENEPVLELRGHINILR